MIQIKDVPGDLGKEMRTLFYRLRLVRDQIDVIVKDYAPETGRLKLGSKAQSIEAVHEGDRQGLPVKDIADAVHLSRYTVYRLLKKQCSVDSCRCHWNPPQAT